MFNRFNNRIYRRGIFVYHHRECSLSYPFRFLDMDGCRIYFAIMTGEILSSIVVAKIDIIYWTVRSVEGEGMGNMAGRYGYFYREN